MQTRRISAILAASAVSLFAFASLAGAHCGEHHKGSPKAGITKKPAPKR